jgi:hypothetical protein
LEVGELATLLAAAVQDRRRVEGRDHGAPVPRMHGTTHPGDALRRLQHELRGEVPERHDHDGLDQRDLFD